MGIVIEKRETAKNEYMLVVEKNKKLYDVGVTKEEYYVNQVGKPLKISATGEGIIL